MSSGIGDDLVFEFFNAGAFLGHRNDHWGVIQLFRKAANIELVAFAVSDIAFVE